MKINTEVLISSSLGSLISVLGSIVVAFLIINNQVSTYERTQTSELIQEIYFEEGIFRIEIAISSYGTSTVNAIEDVGQCIWNYYLSRYDQNRFEEELNMILSRSDIVDLSSRDYTLASKWYSRNLIFGQVFYHSIKETLQLYSDFLIEILTPETIYENYNRTPINELTSSLYNMSKIFEYTELYIETRCEYLIEYILDNNYHKINHFINIQEEETYNEFLSELEEYLKLLNDFRNSFLYPSTSTQREKASSNFSYWLTQHVEKNPFNIN